jgi:peptidoglycan/LPS O-acetylase OafA/YrhL
MKAKNIKSIETTNTLKGIAISAVLINHYLNLNISGDSTGFANAWIAIFFFLSGYGLFHSLTRHNLYNAREWFLFYYQRIVRVFPLLWIAWFIDLIVRRGNISLWTPTGIHASGHYWFIPALLQCYLVSPVIYLAIKKRPIISLFTLLGILISVNYFLLGHQAPAFITKIAKFIHANWRGI